METRKPRLTRSRTNRMLGGVCGGLGEYLRMDPTIIRLLFLVLIFGTEFGFLLYLLLWILVPEEGGERAGEGQEISGRVKSMGDDIQQAVSSPHPQAGVIIGAALIIVGAVMVLERLNILWLGWLDFDVLWPLILIAGGAAILYRQLRGEGGES